MSSATGTPLDSEPVVLAAAARLLAESSARDAVPALLDLLRRATGAASVELESATGCVAVGSPVAAAGRTDGVTVVRAGEVVGVLHLAHGRSRPRLVEIVADLLAVALVPDPALGGALLLEADADLEAVAGRLHDGPAQDAVASRYAASLLARGVVTSDDVSEALDRVGRGLRAAISDLHRRGQDGDLGAALLVLAQGHPGVTVTVGQRLPVLDPATAALGYRVVQAASALGGQVRAEPGADGGVDVAVADLPADLAHEVQRRFRARCAALGARLDPQPGSLRLRLPAAGNLRKDTA